MTAFRNRLRSERGMTLPEMLVSMILMLVVMGATLTTLDEGGTNRRLNEQRNDAVETARGAMDTVVRQLRNLASPSAALPSAIDRAQPTDFAFRTFDPTKKVVRYCLSDAPQGSSDANVLFQMVLSSANTPPAGSYANCRSNTSNWNRITRVAANVVNKRSGTSADRDVFTFNGNVANTSTITNVRMQLLVDVNSDAKKPTQLRLSSGAALRNQNQAPTARFTVNQQAGTRHFTLNATSSSDPENRTLTYAWYVGLNANYDPLDTSVATTEKIGTGAVLDYTFPAAVGPNRYFKLIVNDSNLTNVCPTSIGTLDNCLSAGPYTI